MAVRAEITIFSICLSCSLSLANTIFFCNLYIFAAQFRCVISLIFPFLANGLGVLPVLVPLGVISCGRALRAAILLIVCLGFEDLPAPAARSFR